MCNTHTPYYMKCQHYGRRTVVDEPCIRATSQNRGSTGCGYWTDQGVESVDELCPACRRGNGEGNSEGKMRDPDADDGGSGTEGKSQSQTQPGKDEPFKKGCSTNAPSFSSKRQSSSNSAKMLLSSLRASMGGGRNGTSTGVPSQTGQSMIFAAKKYNLEAFSRNSQQTENLHWRMFDNRGYGEVEE